MLDNEVIVRVGGAAGDGVASTGENLAKTFARSGYQVHAYSAYQSVIRGGHVWYNVRAATELVPSQGDAIDVLIALDQQTAELHAPDVRSGGAVIYDEGLDSASIDVPEDVRAFSLPLAEIGKKYHNNPLMRNTVALGVACKLMGLDLELIENGLEEQFGAKGGEVLEKNLSAFRDGVTLVEDEDTVRDCPVVGERRPLVLGNNAIALGAIAAGCTFYAAYPMTPASGILHYLAREGPQQGVVVKQAEDELAVMNMTIGAGFSGARAMCGTSGGGFALMTEAIGMAGMAEIGCVIVESQRAGPSTGLPTKTEQGDLNQMYGASQGDFPKAILAPGNVREAFEMTVQAHELADRYQMPVILASDFYLSEHMETLEIDDFPETVAIDRGPIASANGADQRTDAQGREVADGKFARYALGRDDGVSPRGIPGTAGTQFVAGTDEHDEFGNLVSDWYAGVPRSIVVRNEQMQKRMGKLDAVLAELPAPELEGDANAPVIVTWGSTHDVVEEARAMLEAEHGVATAQLHFRYIQPFHAKEATELLSDRTFIVVEANYTGQFERHVRAETGLTAAAHIRRYDGELFAPGELAAQLKEVITSL